jgi:hypothetical protein
VVVDDVEDHLESLLVEGAHHLLEFADLVAVLPGEGVPARGRKEVDGVVAPVVLQPLLHEKVLVHDLVDGQELDGGDAQRLQVLDDGRVGDGRVGASEVLRHVGVEPGEPLHVGFVDHRPVPRDGGRAVAAPIERGVDHDPLRHAERAVRVVHDPVVPRLIERVGEGMGVPPNRSGQGARIRIDQQLGRVEPEPAGRLIGSVDPIAVVLARSDPVDVAVPDVIRTFAEALHPVGFLGLRRVEETEVHLHGVPGEEREVGSLAVPGRPEG